MRDGVTVQEAREEISSFLQENGCYNICAKCPVYGEDGCCRGCSNLIRGSGCLTPNLSCLSYTCGVLNKHLLLIPSEDHGNKLVEFTNLVYGMPREGYRGVDRLPGDQELEMNNPLNLFTLPSEEEENA